jgi:hypothetical protein
MSKYKMTVVFEVHEEVEMKYVYREGTGDNHESAKGVENAPVIGKTPPHINKLYEDVFERIETAHKHPITYEIVSFGKLN